MTIKSITLAILILSIIVPFGVYLFGEKKKGNFKAALCFNVLFYQNAYIYSHSYSYI